jgi:cellobiose phosphorylase
MYRLIVESLLGVHLSTPTGGAARLQLRPCLPPQWPGFTLDYRYRATRYRIEVTQGSADDGAAGVTVDGVAQHDMAVPLVDDHRPHVVEVRVHRRA